MSGFLYVADAAELARLGADTSLPDAQAQVDAYAVAAQAAQDALEIANRETGAIKAGREAVYGLLETERAK